MYDNSVALFTEVYQPCGSMLPRGIQNPMPAEFRLGVKRAPSMRSMIDAVRVTQERRAQDDSAPRKRILRLPHVLQVPTASSFGDHPSPRSSAARRRRRAHDRPDSSIASSAVVGANSEGGANSEVGESVTPVVGRVYASSEVGTHSAEDRGPGGRERSKSLTDSKSKPRNLST